MDPIGKFQRSWLLLKSSLSVIGTNKKLLAFPILIFSLTMIIVLFFVAPAVLRPTGHPYISAEHWQAIGNSLFTRSPDGSHQTYNGITPAAAVYLAFVYFVSMFLATFLNVAFYHEILAALGGDTISIGRGLKFATTKLGAILMWTLFAGLVGLVIKNIERRFGIVGQIIARLIGVAWSVAAVFVIPVLVQEEESSNPITLLRKSASILKRTWGEALIGYVGLSFANGLIAIGSMAIVVAAGFVSAKLQNFWLLGIVAAGWIVTMFVWSYIVGVASQVYKGALYLYAANGVVPEPYSEEMLHAAWKFKK